MELPDTLNDEHRMLIVSSRLDPGTERIIEYLSEDYGVNINAVSFQFFDATPSGQLLARVFLLEPGQVSSQAERRKGTKRRRYLSPEELEQGAVDAGVGDLYRAAVRTFEPLFEYWRPTRSTFGFKGESEGKRGVMLNLLPFRSSEEKGLHFQIYWSRVCSAFGLDSSSAEHVLPTNHQLWAYGNSDDPYWSGFEGYFTNASDVEKLASALTAKPSPTLA